MCKMFINLKQITENVDNPMSEKTKDTRSS